MLSRHIEGGHPRFSARSQRVSAGPICSARPSPVAPVYAMRISCRRFSQVPIRPSCSLFRHFLRPLGLRLASCFQTNVVERLESIWPLPTQGFACARLALLWIAPIAQESSPARYCADSDGLGSPRELLNVDGMVQLPRKALIFLVSPKGLASEFMKTVLQLFVCCDFYGKWCSELRNPP
jgi:hypothetical protein